MKQTREDGEENGEKRDMSAIPKCFQLTGLAKLNGVKEYVTAVMENDVKTIIFAHHKAVLDQLEEFVEKKLKVRYIRIDGSVPM